MEISTDLQRHPLAHGRHDMDSINNLDKAATHPLRKWTGMGAVAFAGAMLLGCSVAGPRSSPLPQDGPTMIEIYRQHMQSEVKDSAQAVRERLPLREATDRDPGRVKSAVLAKTENRFPRLYNPDLVMYVMPHLSKGKYPIPGYVTVFPMYETVEYAMPGEQAERRASMPTPRSETVTASPAAKCEAKTSSVTR